MRFKSIVGIAVSLTLMVSMIPASALAGEAELSAANAVDTNLQAASLNPRADAFYGIIQQYSEECGEPCYVNPYSSTRWAAGVGYADLIDMDGDGAEELVLAHSPSDMKGSKWANCSVFEIWDYENDTLECDYSGALSYHGTNGTFPYIEIYSRVDTAGCFYLAHGCMGSNPAIYTEELFGYQDGAILSLGKRAQKIELVTSAVSYYDGFERGSGTLGNAIGESEYSAAFATWFGASNPTAMAHAHLFDDPNTNFDSEGLSLDESLELTRSTIARLESERHTPEQVDTLYSQTADTLLKNTNRLPSPLSEYNDPLKYSEKYRKSASGWIQTFISQYGKLKSDKEVWTASYESALIDILNNDETVKEVSRLGKYDKWLQKGFSAVAGEIESAAKVKKVLSQEGKLLSIMLSALTDTQKLSIKQDYAKIELLEGIRDNTSDELLKKACENCMGAYFSNTINTVKGIAIDALPKVLVKGAAAADLATAPVISKALSVGGLATTSAVLTGAAEALGYVGIILLAKDVASWLTGMDARTDAYLKTACLEGIYQSGRSAYNKIVGDTPSSYHVSWFNFILQAKQKQYASMAKIYTSGTWAKELKSDGFLANRCKLIKSVTVSNYSKSVAASTVEVVGATYTGKAIKPAVVVKMGDTKLSSGKDYAVSYSNNVKAGKGLVSVKAKGNYKGGINVNFQIKQANNTAKATKTSVKSTIKVSALAKKAKAVKLPLVKSLFGKAKWSVVKKDKKKVLSLSGSKVKVKKGAKKGTYTIKLKASVAKSANYKAATSKVVTVKVKVK